MPKQPVGENVTLPNLAPAGAEVSVLNPYGVGVDTHKKFIQVCVLVQHQQRVTRYEQEFETTWPSLSQGFAWVAGLLAQFLEPDAFFPLRYTIESTGTYHYPILLNWKGKPSIVNPTLAGPTKRKTDVLDARLLAHHALCGLWPPTFVPSTQDEVLRVLLGMRHECGRAATRMTNRINNHLLRFGHTVGRTQSMSDTVARACVEDMARGIVPVHEAICPDGLPPETWDFFLDSYRGFDQWKQWKERYQKAADAFVRQQTWPTLSGSMSGAELLQCLTSVPGVGTVTALTWLAIICDPRRFSVANQVAAYCGCDPSIKVSAGKVTSHAKRKGNAKLHHMLKNVSAQLVRRRQEAFGLWGFNILRRSAKGGWGKAINAVSRRIATAMWQVHLRGEKFSYDKYRLCQVPNVPDVPIEQMNLSTRYTRVLHDAGYHTTQSLARGFYGTLPEQKGVGAGCLQKVRAWLEANKRQESSSRGESSEGTASTTPTKKPAKSGNASATPSTPPAESTTSRRGSRRSTTASVRSSTRKSTSTPT